MTKSGVITMSRSNIRDWRIRQIIYFQPKNPSNRVAKLANFLDWDPKKEDLCHAINQTNGRSRTEANRCTQSLRSLSSIRVASLTRFCITNVINVNERKAS